MRLIDADKLIEKAYWHGDTPSFGELYPKGHDAVDVEEIENSPTIDAVPVVRCVDCRIHEKCTTEDRFRFCGIEDGYCRAGIRKGVFDEVD